MEIESDSLLVIQAIRSLIKILFGFSIEVEECKILLKSLSHVFLHFVKRSADQVAHTLARQSQCYIDCIFKEENVPSANRVDPSFIWRLEECAGGERSSSNWDEMSG